MPCRKLRLRWYVSSGIVSSGGKSGIRELKGSLSNDDDDDDDDDDDENENDISKYNFSSL